MFHSFSAAEPFGEKEEKSIKKCYLHFISLLLFLFLDAFSNLGGWSLKRICGLMFWILWQPPSPAANLVFTCTYLRWDMTSFNTHLYPTVSAWVQTLLEQDESLILAQMEHGGIGCEICGPDLPPGLWLPPGIGCWMMRLLCGLAHP